MNVKSFNERYGRVMLIMATLLIWAVIIRSFFTLGYAETWELWRVPTVLPPFFDFRLIPGSAETFQSGVDPSVSNPNDPAGRVFNYPKIWYLIFYTGISQDDTIWICILLLISSFFVILSFFEGIYAVDALVMLGVIFSPACALLYERGNVDLIFFIMTGIFILLLERHSFVALGGLLLAAFFKLFPFFGMAALLHENRARFYKLFLPSAAIFLIYVLLNIESLQASWTLTERGTRYSYGSRIIFEVLYDYVRYYLLKVFNEGQVNAAIPYLPHLAVLSVLGFAFWLGSRQKNGFTAVFERNLIAFRVGAAIYVGTFLLGNNWDYRMIFLVFVLPQLAEWVFRSSGPSRWISLGVLIVLLGSCWGLLIHSSLLEIWKRDQRLFILVFDESMNWGLFAGLAYLLTASAPSWFRTFSWNPFSGNSQLSEEAS